MNRGFEGKVAPVTGGTSGIGRATALALVRRGAVCLVVGRDRVRGEAVAAVAAGLPIRRLGRPEEVAEAVLWLASPASSFVVGHILTRQ